MIVWLPYSEEASNPILPPSIASESKVSASYVYDQISAVNDQILPKRSNDQEVPRFTFWSHKGTDEWIRYDLKEPTAVSYIHVYWFDDGPDGGCRLPEAYKVYYLSEGKWKEITKHGNYPLLKDQMNSIEIAPIRTTALKMDIKLKAGYSGGILEWKIE
jgi:hypothetical protein